MTSFDLTCACGQPLHGERQRRHQLVLCPACGRTAFVFPLSPYDIASEKQPRASAAWHRSWRTPIIAAVGSILLLLAGFVAAWPYLARHPVAAVEEPEDCLLYTS